MKHTIYDASKKQEEEVSFRLVEDDDGINLVACNPYTGERVDCGHILRISKDGTIGLFGSVSAKIGIQLTEDEYPVVEKV